MDKLKRKLEKREHFIILLRNGFYQGMGWAFGVTLGFALISTLLIYGLNLAGGLPVIGELFANIVEETIIKLEERRFIDTSTSTKPLLNR